jgi:hypothetical protein
VYVLNDVSEEHIIAILLEDIYLWNAGIHLQDYVVTAQETTIDLGINVQLLMKKCDKYSDLRF